MIKDPSNFRMFSAALCVSLRSLRSRIGRQFNAEHAEIRRGRRETQEDYLSVVLQDLHSLRLRAFRVPHAAQRMYIVRVNQLVMNALTPRIPISTAAFKRKSFKL